MRRLGGGETTAQEVSSPMGPGQKEELTKNRVWFIDEFTT